MRIRLATVALLAALPVLLLACGTTTGISDIWRDPAWDAGPFAKILVIGVARNPETRRLFEDRFAAEIGKRGTVATSSHGLLPDAGRLSESRVRAAVADGSFDGVLVTNLVSRGEESTTVQPRPYATPRRTPGYYGDYTVAWEVVQLPSYTVTNEVVCLATRLYDLHSGERVWAGQSATLDPRSLEAGIASVTSAVAKRLAADGMIR
jgi:hypothetical protein